MISLWSPDIGARKQVEGPQRRSLVTDQALRFLEWKVLAHRGMEKACTKRQNFPDR